MAKKKQTKGSDFASFDLDNPELPGWIDKLALGSGGFPFDHKMDNDDYSRRLHALQIELAKLQRQVVDHGERIAIVIEGRDAAGKGGVIKRVTEYLNPRSAHVVALAKPSDTERDQWYFQRYVEHLPARGNLTLFDRSWYNRAGVERVFGFCTDEEYEAFLRETPDFEGLIQRGGIRLFKFWLTIGREMQLKRFHARRHDQLKQWKLSDIDIKAIPRWDEYTAVIEVMFQYTHNFDAPWWVIRANDKRRARLAIMQKVLSELDYERKDVDAIGAVDERLIGNSPDFFFGA